LMASAP